MITTGEHYFVDLVAAIPFCWSAKAGWASARVKTQVAAMPTVKPPANQRMQFSRSCGRKPIFCYSRPRFLCVSQLALVRCF